MRPAGIISPPSVPDHYIASSSKKLWEKKNFDGLTFEPSSVRIFLEQDRKGSSPSGGRGSRGGISSGATRSVRVFNDLAHPKDVDLFASPGILISDKNSDKRVHLRTRSMPMASMEEMNVELKDAVEMAKAMSRSSRWTQTCHVVAAVYVSAEFLKLDKESCRQARAQALQAGRNFSQDFDIHPRPFSNGS